MKRTGIILAVIGLYMTSCGDQSQDQSQSASQNGEDDGLMAMVMNNGKYGYVNSSGAYVIEPDYVLASTFSNGMACVNVGGQRNDIISGAVGGIYAFIDTRNNAKFDGESFSHAISFDNNFGLVNLENEKKGYINRKGTLVIEGFDALGPFREGLAAAMKKDEEALGYIDTLGNWKIKYGLKYLIGNFYEGLAYFRDEDKFGYIDKYGEIAIQPTFEEAYDFHEGLATIAAAGKYGFINNTGEVVIPAIYEDVSDFSEGLCAVQVNGKWGYIDVDGNVEIDPKFESVRDFNEGMASVLSAGKVGFINHSGDWVIQPIFESTMDFKNGFAIIQQKGLMGFVNAKGEVVIEAQYDRVGNMVNPFESNEIIKVNYD